MTYQYFSSGAKLTGLTAQQVNGWTRAAEQSAAGRNAIQAAPAERNTGNHFPVQNTTGGDLEAYSTVMVSTPAIDPTIEAGAYEDAYKHRIALVGEEVDTDDIENIAITQIALDDNAVDGSALLAGVTFARMNGPASKAKATTKNNDTYLTAADSGPCIIIYDPGPANEERIAVVRIGGGGGGCTTQFAIWLLGVPTGGSITIPVTVNSVQENVQLDWNESTSGAVTAFEGHSEIAVDSVTATSPGGGFPFQVMRFTFTDDVVMGHHTNNLTGGSNPYALVDKCCG